MQSKKEQVIFLGADASAGDYEYSRSDSLDLHNRGKQAKEEGALVFTMWTQAISHFDKSAEKPERVALEGGIASECIASTAGYLLRRGVRVRVDLSKIVIGPYDRGFLTADASIKRIHLMGGLKKFSLTKEQQSRLEII